MSSELDDVARSLFLGQIPTIWRKLAPDTLKSLGNWMVYFLRRFSQYTSWVRGRCLVATLRGSPDPVITPTPSPTQHDLWSSRLGALELLSDSTRIFSPFLFVFKMLKCTTHSVIGSSKRLFWQRFHLSTSRPPRYF